MVLSDIFNHLTYGELSQLSLGGLDGSGIDSSNYPQVISYINMGLTELHKRFPLRTKEVLLQQYEDISTYYLLEKYAVNSGSAELIKYLVDTPNDLFKNNNFFKIERIDDEEGCELSFNDPHNSESIMSPSYNAVQFVNPIADNTVAIVYRSNHDLLDINLTDDPDTVHIDIPTSLLDCLVTYIAGRAYANRPTIEGISQSQKYMQLFEAACALIQSQSLITRDNTTNNRFEINGWG